MNVIIENVLTSVTADSEDSSYPATNLTDDRPKLVWKADGDDTATLVCSNTGSFDTVAVFNTNADSFSATVSDPNEITFDGVTWDGVTWIQGSEEVIGDLITQADGSAIWLELDAAVTSTMNVNITLTAATGESVEAGVVVLGVGSTFPGPRYGFQQGLIDYSISKEASNGSEYYKPRDRVRTFDIPFLANRSSQTDDFYTFMNTLARDIGKSPLAWRLVDGTNTEWIVYGRLTDMPMSYHSYPNHAPVSFSLKEVL